jgi:hypothetical protein
MKIPFTKDEETAILASVGQTVPALLREAVDEGFHRYKVSRALDPFGFPDYGPISKANMLYDRIASAARDLISTIAPDLPQLRYSIHSNTKSTEITLDPYFAFRIKRTKANRRNMPSSYGTDRQKHINAPFWTIGQLRIPFQNLPLIEMEDRLWLTVGFDLDDIEEQIERTVIGVTTRRRWMWRQPLMLADADIIASFPPLLADRINEMRVSRSA